MAFEGMAHMGTTFCGNGIAVCCGIVVVGLLGLFEVVSPAVTETAPSFMSTYALLAGRLRFFFSGGSPGSGSEFLLLLLEGEVVGIFRVPFTDIAMAGTVAGSRRGDDCGLGVFEEPPDGLAVGLVPEFPDMDIPAGMCTATGITRIAAADGDPSSVWGSSLGPLGSPSVRSTFREASAAMNEE
ncbi:hypothetical protein SESBI_35652 [Sesbania bispinosa]|nr:hypothetical protein SESBI_35652 [Sesbania bispinosa]